MSHVTNVILNMGMESDKLESVNTFFEGETGFISFDSDHLPHGWYGGTKFLEVHAAIGAFNHLDLDGLKQHLKEITWEDPDDVQLLICDQEVSRFSVWNLSKLKE